MKKKDNSQQNASLHKSGFKLHTIILRHVYMLVTTGKVKINLRSPELIMASPAENIQHLNLAVHDLLAESFPQSSQQLIRDFVANLPQNAMLANEQFKQALRDFLISLKEFSEENNQALYQEEREEKYRAEQRAEMERRIQVPGLVNPHEADMSDL